jgi:hypothetical protein
VNATTRVGTFGAGLAVVFAAAFGVGRLADVGMPSAPDASHAGGGHVETPVAGHVGHESPAAAAELPGGLQVAEGGYRLVLDHTTVEPGRRQALSFRVVDADGQPLTSYTTTHDKDLHLIVVRRDLSGFQHVHPALAPDGTWSTKLELDPGVWRVLADFDPAGDDPAVTLGADLFVPGPLAPQRLPAPSSSAEVDGYTVTLEGALTPGVDSELSLSVSRDGTPVTDLQPYLAAYGHLVALRQGDLAYLHVHPDGAPGDGHTTPGPRIVFHTTAPSAGTYRLYLDFKHEGVVRTAELTVTAGKEATSHGH